MNAVALIQARLGSERLPGKILKDIGGFPALGHTVARAEAAGYPAFVVCPLKDMWEIQLRLKEYRLLDWATLVWGWDGPDEDVLGRFSAFLKRLDPDGVTYSTVIRLTADCPWVDVDTIYAVTNLVHTGVADFASTNETYDQPHWDGYDVEAFSADLLRQAHREAWEPNDREHVTSWMRRNAERPWISSRMARGPRRRWTLDTPEDLEWFRAVAEVIDVTPPNHPTHEELLALERTHPELERTREL